MVTTTEEARQEAEKLLSHFLAQGYSITDLYPYPDKTGDLSHWRVRLDHPDKGKEIRPISFINGKWELKEPKFPDGKPLYNLHEIINRPDETVWIVEGEKCADALIKLGRLATTSGSAASTTGTDWTALHNRKIICWPDNDESGYHYIQDILIILINKILKVEIVDLRQLDLPEKGDCVDWLEMNPNSDQSDIDNLPLVNANAFDLSFSNWEEPVLFQNASTPEIRATLLPEPFGKYAETLAHSVEVPEGLAVFGVLGAVSSAIGHRIKVSPKPGWEETANLYLLAILPPGNNKSAVLKACTFPLTEWEKAQAELKSPEIKKAQSERKNLEELIKRKRIEAIKQKDHDLQKLEFHEISEMEASLEEAPLLPQIFITDATPESLAKSVCEQKGRFAVISDEGGIMDVLAGLYNKGQSNINIILNGIDGGHVRIKRTDTSIYIDPLLTFCLFAQPAVLQNMARQKSFIGKGLLERFLYLIPETKLGYRTHDTEPIQEDIKQAYQQKITELLDLCMDSELGLSDHWVLELSLEASEKFRKFQLHIETELRPSGKLYPISGWGGKICGFSLRIAGLLHVMEHDIDCEKISLSTINKALELASLLIDHALTAFGEMRADPSIEDAKDIFNWIKSNGQWAFKKNDCHRAFSGRFQDVKELEEVLIILQERNIVSPPIEVKSGGKGRPSIFYRVNPNLFGR